MSLELDRLPTIISLRRWAASLDNHMISFLVRAHRCKRDGTKRILSYDFSKNDGPKIVYCLQDSETFEQAQKRILMQMSKSYDLVNDGKKYTFATKANAILDFPGMDKAVTDSSNVYPVVIPDCPNSWLPMATEFSFIDPIHADLIYKADVFSMTPFVNSYTRRVVCPNNHLVTGKFYQDSGIPSLSVLAMRKLSMYNLAFGGTSEYPYVSNAVYKPLLSLSNRLMRLFKPHVAFNSGFDFQDMYRAMNYYYKNCVKLEKLRFTMKAGDFADFPFPKTKASYRIYPNLPEIKHSDGTTISFNTHPSKKQAKHILMRDLIRDLNVAAEETYNTKEIPTHKNLERHIVSMSVKNQNQSSIDNDDFSPQGVKEINEKSRLFFLVGDSMLHRLFKTDRKSVV